MNTGLANRCRSDGSAAARTVSHDGHGSWPSRLLTLALVLVVAWPLDRLTFFWSRNVELRRLLAPISASARQFGEPAGIGLILIAVWALDRNRRRAVARILLIVLLASGVSWGIKLLVGRERPYVASGYTVLRGPQWPGVMVPDASFPSGHTTAAFALAAGLSRLYPHGRGAFIGFAAACGASRLLNGKHFLSDVLVAAWLAWHIAGPCWNAGWVRRAGKRLPNWSWFPAWSGEAWSAGVQSR